MPTISCFYGIIIVMYLRDKEHNPPAYSCHHTSF